MAHTRFIVLGSQRTGSTLIRTSLDSHPAIRCYGEVFLMPGSGPDSYPLFVSQSGARKFRDLVMRGRLVSEFLDALYDGDEFQAIGFKFMYSQARGFPYRRAPTVVDYVRQGRIKVIHVVRDNALKTLVSRTRAKRTGVYHVKGEAKAQIRIHVPVRTLIRDLTQMESEDREWADVFRAGPYLQVRYEQFVESPDAVSSGMLEFLDIQGDARLTSPHQKVITSGLPDVIENYEEVSNALQGTEYARFLD